MRKLYALLLLILCLIGGAFTFNARAQTALGPGFYNDDFFLLSYTGTITTFGDSVLCVDGGDRHRLDVFGDTLEFDFWGDGFTLYTVSNNNVGAQFSLCGSWSGGCSAVSLYDPAGPGSMEIDILGLGYGTHSVQLGRDVTNLNICGLLIHPPAPQPTLEPVEIVVTVQIEVEDLLFPTQIPVVPVGEPAYRTYFEMPSTSEQPQFLAVDNLITPADMIIVLFLVGIFALILRHMVRMGRHDD
jgi:hypothetical protein